MVINAGKLFMKLLLGLPGKAWSVMKCFCLFLNFSICLFDQQHFLRFLWHVFPLLLQLLPRHLEECCFNYPQVRFNLIYYGSVTSDPFHTNRLHLQTKVREHTHTRTHTHSHTRTRTHSHTRTCTHMHTNTHRNSHVVSVRTETFPTSLMLINGNWEKKSWKKYEIKNFKLFWNSISQYLTKIRVSDEFKMKSK